MATATADLASHETPIDGVHLLRNLLVGLAGAACFGAASVSGYWVSGASEAQLARSFSDATGPVSAMLAINALGFPALAILLTLTGSDYDWHKGLAAFGEATLASGIILLGLTPLLALYSLTLSGHNVALGLLATFAVCAASTVALWRAIPPAAQVNFRSVPVVLGFTAFALALSLRFSGTFLWHAF